MIKSTLIEVKIGEDFEWIFEGPDWLEFDREEIGSDEGIFDIDFLEFALTYCLIPKSTFLLWVQHYSRKIYYNDEWDAEYAFKAFMTEPVDRLKHLEFWENWLVLND